MLGAYFLPLAQAGGYGVVPRLFLRAGGNLDDALALVRRTLQGASADLPVVSVRTLQSQLDPLLAPWRLGSYAFSAFGVLATIIAMTGLFGVLAYLVTERSAEFAVRSALGARPVQIARPVVVQGVVVVGIGVLAGIAITGVLGRWLQPMLFQTRLIEPGTAVAIALLLTAVALLASLGPAHRAGRRDPMDILRS
jgi:ABC-type antimicrobial peptide transport system permease subunit